MARANKTRYAILGVLSVCPGSGYDIKKFCDRSIAHFWNENFGQIYPELRQMEAEGLVTHVTEAGEGKPARNVYSITVQGKAVLAGWLAEPAEPSPTRHELLLKLIFSKDLPREKTVEKLEATRSLHLAHLEEYRRLEAEYTASEKAQADKGYPYWLAALRYGIQDAEFRVRWCEETIAMFRGVEHDKTMVSMAEVNKEKEKVMKEQYRKYLVSKGYSEITENGNPSTVYDYVKRIDKVCEWENFDTWSELSGNISSIINQYDIGGNKEELGEKSHRAVINALKRFSEFLVHINSRPSSRSKTTEV